MVKLCTAAEDVHDWKGGVLMAGDGNIKYASRGDFIKTSTKGSHGTHRLCSDVRKAGPFTLSRLE